MPDRPDLPQATVVPRRTGRISVVWVIPIVAALVAIGIAVQRIMNEGPTITIVFAAAAGLEAGKTLIRYKDVTIGQVTAVQLTDDYRKVTVTAKIAKDAAGLMVEGARFWIVEPRISLSGVSGLGTLLSGNYIGFAAGKSDRRQREFVGLADPPPITGEVPGREFILRTDTLGSLNQGLPVYFRQFPVGEVIGSELDPKGQGVLVRIYVRAPYDQYVTTNTRFWNASGVDVSLSATGLQVRTESLVSVLVGGVAFQTPPDGEVAPPAESKAVFQLFGSRTEAMRQPDRDVEHYVIRFAQSVRGLSVGAPVEFRGVNVGEVTHIGVEFDPKTFTFVQPVEIAFYPERLRSQVRDAGAAMPPAKTAAERARRAQLFIDRGFRAQLRTGNLITGQSYIGVDIFPKAPKVKVDVSQNPIELPSIPGVFDELETTVASIVKKLDRVQYEQISADVRKTMGTLDQAIKDVDVLVKQLNSVTAPELNGAIADARRAIRSADGLLASGSPVETDLREALREITRAAASLRVLTDYLERQPQSLIRGKPAEEARP
jgi:paraquat-inducible protein B